MKFVITFEYQYQPNTQFHMDQRVVEAASEELALVYFEWLKLSAGKGTTLGNFVRLVSVLSCGPDRIPLKDYKYQY